VSGNAPRGIWTRAIPAGTIFGNSFSNPNEDIEDDFGPFCYVTGNDNSTVGADDVDDGSTFLTSPSINLSTYIVPEIHMSAWFFNDGGASSPNDAMDIYILTADDTLLVQTINDTVAVTQWNEISISPQLFTDAQEIKIMIEVSDDTAAGHLVEGGIDGFFMIEKETSTATVNPNSSKIKIWPNPAQDLINVSIESDQSIKHMALYDILGIRYPISINNSQLDISALPHGQYFISLMTNDNLSYIGDFIKIAH
jgi:hypothetical protein